MIGQARISPLPSVLAAALLLAACGPLKPSSSAADPGGRTSDDLTAAELSNYATVMEAVQVLRPIWLRQRTPVVLSARGGSQSADPVWIYWDGTRLGDTSYLGRIATSDVSRVKHYDAREASLRWGMSHENGVIYLVPAVGSVGPVLK